MALAAFGYIAILALCAVVILGGLVLCAALLVSSGSVNPDRP